MNAILWIMNHEPSQDQIADLKQRYGNDVKVITLPPEAAKLMAQIPAEADLGEVRTIADTILKLLPREEGAAYVAAVVQGEPCLQSCLVQTLQKCRIRCFAATTARKSVESVQSDGSTVKTNVFRHVSFREYPWLAADDLCIPNPFLKD